MGAPAIHPNHSYSRIYFSYCSHRDMKNFADSIIWSSFFGEPSQTHLVLAFRFPAGLDGDNPGKPAVFLSSLLFLLSVGQSNLSQANRIAGFLFEVTLFTNNLLSSFATHSFYPKLTPFHPKLPLLLATRY